jgi:putative ABC transport system permease protein
MMNAQFLSNTVSLLALVLKRLRHNLGLSASALIGIISILTVAVCVPIFSHAISADVLHRQLQELKGVSSRPLFSLRFVYKEKTNASLMDIEKSQAIGQYLSEQISQQLGLPVEQVVMDIRAGGIVVTDLTGRWPEAKNSPLGRWSFVIQENLPLHAQIVEGEWPKPGKNQEGPIQVAVPEAMADEMLLKIGDHFLLDPLEVQVVGFWTVTDLQNPIWFSNPNADYSRTLWVPQATYLTRIKPNISQPVEEVSWYVMTNDRQVQFQRAAQYLRGLVRLDADLKKIVEGIETSYTPIEALAAYEKRAESLATLFYVVGAPMIVLALIFIGLTARISVQQYENETAILRARGASRTEVMGMNLAESLVLFAIAIPLSLILGWLAANLMNQTLSFLQFTSRSIFEVSFDGLNYTILGAAIATIAVARFLPVISASKISVLRVKQDQSRGGQKPFWERFFLDFLLLIPGIYAFFIFKGWSQPAQFLSQLQLSGDQQFRDPLLFVAPALFVIALSMIVVRLIPWVVRGMAAIANHLPGVWAYLSLQQIARRSQDHSSAVLLIIIALSLSIYTVSTARTLDQWLTDSEYYKVGADLAVKEMISVGGADASSSEGGPPSAATTQTIEGFLTIEEHQSLPAIANATRVGKYDGKFSYGRGDVTCKIIGLDRLEFPLTAYYREDFASQPLGELMNALGANLDGVLIPSNLMLKNGIALGDRLAVSITAGTTSYSREMMVVGSYDYFPTVFPTDKPTLIANLESIFNYPEDVEGYQMWLKLKPDGDAPSAIAQIGERIGAKQAVVTIEGNALNAVQTGQDKPERIGLFGILNVGFFITGLMPGIGFLLYSYASLRRRFIQLGILQAIGLSVKQLVAALVSEQVILMGLSILFGALIGLISSMMFVPFLQTGATPGAPVPPFQVIIGWAEAAWLSLAFGLVLSLTMFGTIFYLARLKVFQAVKLGETL